MTQFFPPVSNCGLVGSSCSTRPNTRGTSLVFEFILYTGTRVLGFYPYLGTVPGTMVLEYGKKEKRGELLGIQLDLLSILEDFPVAVAIVDTMNSTYLLLSIDSIPFFVSYRISDIPLVSIPGYRDSTGCMR